MLAGPKTDPASALRSVFCEATAAAVAAAKATETAAHLSEPASELQCHQGLFVQRQSQHRVILFVILLHFAHVASACKPAAPPSLNPDRHPLGAACSEQ